MKVNKLVKDGLVAVIVSPGFGAGWSTWNSESEERMIFDPILAQMILDGKTIEDLELYAKDKYPEAYLGGLSDAEVEWVPVGSRFTINEYDGNESLTMFSPDFGFSA